MQTIGFALIAAGLVAAALACVLPALWRRADAGGDRGHAAANAEVTRRQLAELEFDVARGLFAAEDVQAEQDRLRRGLLAAAAGGGQAARPRRWAAPAVALALPLLATLMYLHWGTPGALAPSSRTPESGGVDGFLSGLQRQVEATPRDGRAWVLLARARMEREQFADAAHAYTQALQVSWRVARDPGVLCEAADAIGMEQGGRLSGRPSELIAQALAIDPGHPLALEMAGSAAVEQGRFSDAVAHWSALLEQLPEASERRRELRAAIEAARQRAPSS